LKHPYPDVKLLTKLFGTEIQSDFLNAKKWNFISINSNDVVSRMNRHGIPLDLYLKAPLYTGIKTGFNTAFIIGRGRRAELIAADPKSAELIKPFAIGKDIRKWSINKDKWLIVTKIDVDIARYPAVFAHLSQWQPQLEKRQDQGKHWWELRACAYYSEFEKLKIIVTKAALRPSFTLDDTGIFLGNTAYLISVTDLSVGQYVLGVLNSDTVLKYLQAVAMPIGDPSEAGRVEPRQSDLAQIPIPAATDSERATISALVQKCLDAKGIGCIEWEREIDERVAGLYGL
jgi:hypothetical protein